MPGIPEIVSYPLPRESDLPDNTVPWSIDPDRAVLLVHDLQEFFLRPLPEQMRTPMVAAAAALGEAARVGGAPIAYTAQPGGMTARQRGLLRDFWGPGMRVSAQDRRIVPQVAPAEGDWLLTKWRYSAFHATDLLELMRRHGRDQLVLCGVYAHVGVLATAIESFSNDIETFLVADALADFSAEHHRMALHYAADRCAAVLTTDASTEALVGPVARTR
ncbi:isochorismatase family protein [Streptomonospora litoralis]|uniref:Putative isochorismatase n=1 Tax=Streptomonospora litoralis TaxID=2498135 RepID=A0A4V0ZK20_9ACTN|nr:isochorismatase family protein [Streptomonospora litoralis]QBI55452.1 putative isochorismatase [Streptomonospora litoralis]